MMRFKLWMLFVKKGDHGWEGMHSFAPKWAKRGYEEYLEHKKSGWK